MFGCIRGCSATQSQAEKGRDSIPPIEDEHQQFRPVFSCNPIWRPLSNRISDMGDAPSITKHAFGIRTHEVAIFQTSLLGKWVQVSVLQNIASVCACCNKFKYQSSTIQLYIILKMMWSGNFHDNYIGRASRSRTRRLDRFRGHAHLSCSLGHATHLHCLRQF